MPNLAQRCVQATIDTTALIEESIDKSNDGKAKVYEVAAAIRAITEEETRVKTLVDEVNLGARSRHAAEELNAPPETLKDLWSG